MFRGDDSLGNPTDCRDHKEPSAKQKSADITRNSNLVILFIVFCFYKETKINKEQTKMIKLQENKINPLRAQTAKQPRHFHVKSVSLARLSVGKGLYRPKRPKWDASGSIGDPSRLPLQKSS